MMAGSSGGEPDFYLGERGESRVTDFDGQVRACYLLGRLYFGPEAGRLEGRRHLWVRLDPPLPLLDGDMAEEVLLNERYEGQDFDGLGHDWGRVQV